MSVKQYPLATTLDISSYQQEKQGLPHSEFPLRTIYFSVASNYFTPDQYGDGICGVRFQVGKQVIDLGSVYNRVEKFSLQQNEKITKVHFWVLDNQFITGLDLETNQRTYKAFESPNVNSTSKTIELAADEYLVGFHGHAQFEGAISNIGIVTKTFAASEDGSHPKNLDPVVKVHMSFYTDGKNQTNSYFKQDPMWFCCAAPNKSDEGCQDFV